MEWMPGPQHLQAAISQQWWLGNAAGGWASGTVAGAHTLASQGLLVAAAPHPERRWLLLSKYEETALVSGARISLGCNFHAPPNVMAPAAHDSKIGTSLAPSNRPSSEVPQPENPSQPLQPQGCALIDRFSFDGAVARWTYGVAGRRLGKEIWCAHGHNATHARYTLLEGESLGLEVMPLVSGRALDAIGLPPRESAAPSRISERRIDYAGPVRWSIQSDDGLFRPRPETYRRFAYPKEGPMAQEDLRSPGPFELMLREGHSVTLTAWAEGPQPPAGREAETASRRLDHMVEQFRAYNRFGPLPGLEAMLRSGDAFIVREGRRHNVLAGFPHYGRRCKEAMLSLPGLCILTGRHALARDVIEHWMEYGRHGMLPGHFDARGTPVYDAADGTLWMLWAMSQLDDEGGLTADVLSRWWPFVRNALRSHIAGNEQLKLEGDGLLSLQAGAPGSNEEPNRGLPAISRAGKRVEINALWTHALRRSAIWAARAQDTASAHLFSEAADAAAGSMGKFYNPYARFLDDGIEPTDGTMRPNQLWALALPGIGLGALQCSDALGRVREQLVRPGAGVLGQAQEEGRKEFYSQTAWPAFCGAYAAAQAQCYPQRIEDVRKIMEPMLDGPRGGGVLGLAEYYDAQTLEPGGCALYAPSIAEALRAGILVERMRRHWGPSKSVAGQIRWSAPQSASGPGGR